MSLLRRWYAGLFSASSQLCRQREDLEGGLKTQPLLRREGGRSIWDWIFKRTRWETQEEEKNNLQEK